MTNKNIQNITHFGLILMILICVYFFSQGYFTNPQLLQATLSKAGILAPLLFILLQIIQVIIPIIPVVHQVPWVLQLLEQSMDLYITI